jgi:hypothetical protein
MSDRSVDFHHSYRRYRHIAERVESIDHAEIYAETYASRVPPALYYLAVCGDTH